MRPRRSTDHAATILIRFDPARRFTARTHEPGKIWLDDQPVVIGTHPVPAQRVFLSLVPRRRPIGQLWVSGSDAREPSREPDAAGLAPAISTLPWWPRCQRFGREVQILGAKTFQGGRGRQFLVHGPISCDGLIWVTSGPAKYINAAIAIAAKTNQPQRLRALIFDGIVRVECSAVAMLNLAP